MILKGTSTKGGSQSWSCITARSCLSRTFGEQRYGPAWIVRAPKNGGIQMRLNQKYSSCGNPKNYDKLEGPQKP